MPAIVGQREISEFVRKGNTENCKMTINIKYIGNFLYFQFEISTISILIILIKIFFISGRAHVMPGMV